MTEENVEMTRGENSGQAWVVMGTAGPQHLERFNHLTQNSSNGKRKGMVAHFNWQSKDQAPFFCHDSEIRV